MKEGLLERIRQVGHWRVNIRPLSPLQEPMTLQRCIEAVDSARVSIRGWDYPHVSHRQDEYGGSARVGQYVENWCDWNSQLEFWHMYRSGQFLSYNALNEDLEVAYRNKPDGRFLDIVDTIYSVTEFFIFAHRLYEGGVHTDGNDISIGLINTAGRQLYVGPGRMPFFDPMRTGAPSLEFRRTMRTTNWSEGPTAPALAVLLELFDHFGWNPEPSLISSDQQKFIHRRF